MANRQVKVTLRAVVSDYEQGMRNAANATHAVGTEAEKLAQQKQAFQQLGTASLAMGGMLAAAVALASSRFADFDAAMSSVQASTHASAEDMGVLRQAALDAGESTVFSATEAAAAIEELAKAGVSTADILNGGLNGALDLAAAGGLGVADAAGIASTALKMFGLSGDDMAHVADLLAAGAGKAMGDVSDLSQALNQAGLVASQTGLSIEETTAGLSAFAEQGLLGSDAGTSFKSMLQALNPTSAQAAELMEKYNLSAYDAQGNFVGLAEYAGKLKTGLAGLSVEQQNATLKTIFGSDAVRAASVLYKNGAEGIKEWEEAVNDQGYAAQTAALRLDNLKGDVEALGGAFETALIDTGASANDTLRTMVQALTGLVGIYNDLPGPVQATVMAVGGATAAVALSGGAALLAVPKYLELKATVEGTGMSMKGISLTAGAAGLALGGLFIIVGELAAEHQRAKAKAESYAASLADGTQKVTEATRDLIAENINVKNGAFLWLEGSSMADNAKDLGISLETVRKAVEGDAGAIKELNSVTQEAIDSYDFWDNESIALRSSAENLQDAVKAESEALGDSAEKARDKAAANQESTESAESSAEAYLNEAESVKDLDSQLSTLIDTINEANGVGRDAITSNIDYQNSMAKLDEQIQKARDGVDGYALTLDQGTQAGRDNMDMLVGLGSSAEEAAKKQFDLDGNTAAYKQSLIDSRQSLLDRIHDLGVQGTEAENLANKILRIPSESEWKVIAETSFAQSQIDSYISKNTGREIILKIGTSRVAQGIGGAGGITFATGGRVAGPGTATSDSIPAWLSDGEHVIPADEVKAAGGHEAIEAWRGMLTGQGARALAGRTAEVLPEVTVKAPATGLFATGKVK